MIIRNPFLYVIVICLLIVISVAIVVGLSTSIAQAFSNHSYRQALGSDRRLAKAYDLNTEEYNRQAQHDRFRTDYRYWP